MTSPFAYSQLNTIVKKLVSHFFIITLMLALGLTHVRADETTLQIEVKKPDGTPAAGARAVFRGVDFEIKSPRPVIHTTAMADEQGLVTINVPSNKFGSLMLDMPGCALRFISWWGSTYNHLSPQKLAPEYTISGVTTDEKGNPLGDVDVELTSSYTLYLWRPYGIINPEQKDGLTIPELKTRSRADGIYSLRGVDFVWTRSMTALHPALVSSYPTSILLATTRREGVLHAGVLDFDPRLKDSKNPLHIPLYPEATVRGQVIDATSGQPLSGIELTQKIYASGSPIDGVLPRYATSSIPTTVTDAEGRFTLTVRRPLPLLVIDVVATKGVWSSTLTLGPNKDGIQIPGDELKVPLHRVVSVSGQVVDTQVGEPTVPISIVATLEEKLAGGWTNKVEAVPHEAEIPIRTDGTFTLNAPAGNADLEVRGPSGANGTCVYQTHFKQTVGPEGATGLQLSVSRSPALLLQGDLKPSGPGMYFFESQDSHIVVQMRSADGNITEQVHDGPLWIIPVAKWGNALDVRFMARYGKQERELLPWNKFVADPRQTPSSIHLPKDAFSSPSNIPNQNWQPVPTSHESAVSIK